MVTLIHSYLMEEWLRNIKILDTKDPEILNGSLGNFVTKTKRWMKMVTLLEITVSWSH